MKKLFFAFVILILFACNNPAEKAPAGNNDKPPGDFFPVTSFIRDQVREVDSFKLPIRKFTRSGEKTDSSLIESSEYQELAAGFLHPDINDPSIKKFYKEASFADQSIPSVTLTYSTSNNQLEIQRLDVLVHPDPILNDKVRSVYIEKYRVSADTSISQKMLWQAGKSFQVITSKQLPDRVLPVNVLKVVWGSSD